MSARFSTAAHGAILALLLSLLVPFAAASDADGDGWATPDDCNDSDPKTYPGAPELADGMDNDCDGPIDEGTDQDGDGVLPPADCDDNDPSVHPGAPEVLDGVDNDCNGLVDDLPDADGDGVNDGQDNCAATANPTQADFDLDGRGDACDDTDADNLTDEKELLIGTEPYVRDTDRDSLLDGDEVHTHGTDPLDADTDGDLHKDGTETARGSDPLDALSVPVPMTGAATPGTGLVAEAPLADDLAPLW